MNCFPGYFYLRLKQIKMQGILVFLGVLLIPPVICQDSVVNKSDVEMFNQKVIFSGVKPPSNYIEAFPLGLIIDIRNFSRSQISGSGKKRQGRERVRKWKDKSGKYSRQKNKLQKLPEDLTRQDIRNNEKASLVRNKTIEILKSGLRILSAGENVTEDGNKSPSRVNETLLEKILSSAASKQEFLLSASGAYKLPVGFKMYETKTPLPASHNLVPLSEEEVEGQQIKKPSQNQSKTSSDDYDYDYDLLTDFNTSATGGSVKLYENIDYETIHSDKTIGALLDHIVNALRNLTNCSSGGCLQENKTSPQDPCQKWLNCRESLDRAFIGDTLSLPSCPCTYPSSIFYDEMIWDKQQKKYFRWRDASTEAERLDIYKPGAAYCIRSLLTQGSLSVSSQQCCYDRGLRLLTRGSGAGTMNFISPDVSRKLHYTADILPWRLCKGDFTRYNTARNPNNGNDCPENPDEQQYQLQVKLSKIF